MKITREELYDVLFDIQNKKKNNKKIIYDQFTIIVEKEYLALMTPYSAEWYFYEDIETLINDLMYCLECEVKRK